MESYKLTNFQFLTELTSARTEDFLNEVLRDKLRTPTPTDKATSFL